MCSSKLLHAYARRPRLSALKHTPSTHIKKEGEAPQENGAAQHPKQAPGVASKGDGACAMDVDEQQAPNQDGPAKKRARIGKRGVCVCVCVCVCV